MKQRIFRYWRDLLAIAILFCLAAIILTGKQAFSSKDGNLPQVGTMQNDTQEITEPLAEAVSPTNETPQKEKHLEKSSNDQENTQENLKKHDIETTINIGKDEGESQEATPVEDKPEPVTKMTREKVQQTIKEYKEWASRGDIKLTLDMSGISVEHVKKIAYFYVLKGNSNYLRVDGYGGIGEMENLPNCLFGDIPKSKLPKTISEKYSWFGPGADVNATFALRESYELAIYRAVGRHSVTKGGHFLVSLTPSKDSTLTVNVQQI